MLDRVSPQLFHDLLSDVIRVQMPWQEMDSWDVRLQVVSTASELSELHIPWYRRNTEEIELWQGDIFSPDPADPPVALTVGETAQALPLYDRRRRDTIRRLTTNYRRHKYAQTMLAPAAQLADGRRMLLDGVHRLSSLWLSEVPFHVALFTIQGGHETVSIVDLQRLAEQPA